MQGLWTKEYRGLGLGSTGVQDWRLQGFRIKEYRGSVQGIMIREYRGSGLGSTGATFCSRSSTGVYKNCAEGS